MGQFSFKSSGVTAQTTPANNITQTPPVIGILTPLSLGTSDLLKTSTDLATQMADNLRNLIQTNWGERLGKYDYGANLRPLLVNMVSLDDFDAQAITAIKNAVARWMPYVELVDFLSTTDTTGKLTKGIAQVSITITYNIPSLGVKSKKIKVTLYAL
jgi:phage baseplate assembly protein W